MPKDPVFLKIPTRRIRPNPNQPRRFITQGAIDAMEASLREIGQQTPAKVRALTETEKALGREIRPAQQMGNGKLSNSDHLLDPDHDYELIGGHIRHAGALKAGLATLDCLVLDLTPEQAELAGLVDNQTTDMHWLDWVIAIEKLDKHPSDLSRRAIGVKLGFTHTRINNALKVAKALTPVSRELIGNTVSTLGPENTVSEIAVRTLAELGDPKEVEKALPVFLDRKMTAPQAKTLVKHLKEGKPLAAYHANGNNNGPLAQPNHAPRLVASAQVPSAQPAHPSPLGDAPSVPTSRYVFNFGEYWEKVKTDFTEEGEAKTLLGSILLAIIGFAILGCTIGLVLKLVLWVLSTFFSIHLPDPPPIH